MTFQAKVNGDGSFSVRAEVPGQDAQVFVSEDQVSKAGKPYTQIGKFFGGRAFVTFFEPEGDKSACVSLTLTDDVRIPKAESSSASASAPAPEKKAAAKPAAKPSAKASSNLDDIPW